MALVGLFVGGALLSRATAMREATPVQSPALVGAFNTTADADGRALLDRYCVTCHNARLKTAGLALDREALDVTNVSPAVEVWEKVARKMAYFVDRLRHTPDGDGSLLDHSMLLYGAGISDSNIHMHDNLPLVLVGRAGGRIKGGRHLTYPKNTPVANLFLNMLDIVGVPAEKLGDSTGRLEHLTDL